MPSDQPLKSSRAKGELQASHYGPTGHVVVLPAEDMQAFNRFTGEIVAGLEPVTAIERQLAHLYAACQWRVTRASALEDTLFSVGIMEGIAENMNTLDPKAQIAVSYALTFRSRPDAFEKISRYSQSLVSQGTEVLGQLKQIQTERRTQATDKMTDAARLYLFYRMKNQTFDPKENGFDLTVAQVEEFIRRESLRSDALKAEEADFDAIRCAPKTGSAGA